MSSHTDTMSMRDALFEAPGPRMRRNIRVGTAISLVLVAVALGLVVQRFYLTGQLAAKYWTFFGQASTWAFLGRGFLGTIQVALVAGVIALVLGLVLMLGRTSALRPVALVSRVVIDFFRGVPSLLLIYFFFLVVPQYGIKLSSFWMITLPVGLAVV